MKPEEEEEEELEKVRSGNLEPALTVLSLQPPPAKRGRGRAKKVEQTDGGDEASGSVEPKGKKKAAVAKAKDDVGEMTDWSSVKWTELGQTKDGRFCCVCVCV